MSKYFSFLLFLSLCHFSMAQQLEKQFADDICTRLEAIDLSGSYNTVNPKAIEIIQGAYLENEARMKQEIKNRIATDSNLTEEKALNDFGVNVTLYLTLNCETYQRITIFKNQPIPKFSSVTQKVGKAYDEQMKTAQKKRPLDQDQIGLMLFEVMKPFESEITKNFGSLYSMDFSDEINAYMLTHSELYVRHMLLGQ